MIKDSVLVTGSSGFIGSSIVRYLLKANYIVKPTVRSNNSNLEDELGVKVFDFDLAGDIEKNSSLFAGINTLIHCATPNDIRSRDIDGGLPLAVSGTFRLVEEAVRNGVKRIIYLSTFQVYGTEVSGHVDESKPVFCETPYALNHYLGEEVCKLASVRHGIDVVALRPSNVYGIPCVSTIRRSSLVPMCFIRDLVDQGSIELRSSGRQTRNFISTDEISSYICELLSNFPVGFNAINAVSAWHPQIIEISHMVNDTWNTFYDKKSKVSIHSKHPELPLAFTASSTYLNPQLSAEKSKARMLDVLQAFVQNPNLIN